MAGTEPETQRLLCAVASVRSRTEPLSDRLISKGPDGRLQCRDPQGSVVAQHLAEATGFENCIIYALAVVTEQLALTVH